MNCVIRNTELSSLEETRSQFNGSKAGIKLGIDVHQEFYVVVMQIGGSNPKAPQRFGKEIFLQWAAKLKREASQVHAVYEACGFGFLLQRQLSALGINCYVVCPQKLDEQNKRVKTDWLDAKALCLRLDRMVQGNKDAMALVRVPTEEEERSRAIHRQREQLVKVRKQLEAQGRSLLVNHGLEPIKNWWKPHIFVSLKVPAWVKALLANSQPILLAVQEKISALTVQLQNAGPPNQPRGLGKMTSVIIDREIGAGLIIAAKLAVILVFVPANTPAAIPDCKAASPSMAIRACALRWWSWLGEWCVSSPTISRSKNGAACYATALLRPEQHEKKRSWQWRGNWQLICGESAPVAPPQSNLA